MLGLNKEMEKSICFWNIKNSTEPTVQRNTAYYCEYVFGGKESQILNDCYAFHTQVHSLNNYNRKKKEDKLDTNKITFLCLDKSVPYNSVQ